LALSLWKSVQPPLHALYPMLHAKVHLLATHAACAWTIAVAHALPQFPQSFALVVVSTHVPLHSVGALAGRPDTHAELLPDPEHTGVPPPHALLQLPQ
jgi:hypothetical protein